MSDEINAVNENTTNVVADDKPTAEVQSILLMPYIITGLVTMLITFLLSFAAFQYWQSNYQPRFLTVQMDEVLSNHILEIGATTMSDQKKAEYALAWSRALEETINELTEDNRTIVLTQNATIAGVEDFTEFVEVSAKRKVGGVNDFAK